MDENPYSIPPASGMMEKPIEGPVVMAGILSPEQTRDVADRFSKRKNNSIANTVLLPLFIVMMSAALVYFDYRKVPLSATFWEGFTSIFSSRWYVLFGLPAYLVMMAWLKFHKPTPSIWQEFTFSESNVRIKNEHLTAEFAYDAIQTIHHDAEFMKLDLADPHSGSFALHCEWCQNANDWDAVVAHVTQKITSARQG